MMDRQHSQNEAHTAPINGPMFAALDELLSQHLSNPEDTDVGALAHLLRSSPIETGPLAVLGCGTGAAELQQRLTILRRSYPAIERVKANLNISTSLLPETFEIYIPIARFMAARSREIRTQRHRAAVFGINGGQGSGKTTISNFLQIILAEGLGMKPAGLSIDDVYKTYAQRQEMGRQVHPLFAIRSVAGTHDTRLAIDCLTKLISAPPGAKVPIPSFDKMGKGGQGDRRPQSQWPVIETPVDMVVFEGWCVGAMPQPQSALATPINQREATEDPDGVWRRTMNEFLATDYRQLFEMLDELLVIQVRSMDDVFRNRELQEQHLRSRLDEARRCGEDIGELGAMSPEQVVSFISLYERTTRHMLETLPELAKITLFIGDQHKLERLQVYSERRI